MTMTCPQPPAQRAEAATAPAVDVRGLTKRFGRRTAVAGLDLTVPAGAVAGFIGPNGAGKTTTLRMLLGLIRPTSGDGTVLGEPLAHPGRYLPRVGALIEGPAFYPGLSGRRNLDALATLGGHPRERVDATLAQVGLADRGDDAYRSYSLGMKQRLGIAAALLGEPALLVLDEPTNGLDPTGMREMRMLLRDIAAGGATVLVSSHLLAELEQVCDWLVIVDHGRRIYQGHTDDIAGGAAHAVSIRPERPDQLGALADLAAGTDWAVRRDGDRLTVSVDHGDVDARSCLAALNRAAQGRGIALVEIAPVRTTLEDRYQDLIAELVHPDGQELS